MASHGLSLLAAASLMFVGAQSSIPPTEALHGFHTELRGKPPGDQGPIAARWRGRAQADTTKLSADERLALAELHFVALDPEPAYALFAALAEGNDLRALHASQRMMRIRMAAFDDYSTAEADLKAYRARFPRSPEDLVHLRTAVATLVQRYRTQGQDTAAARVILDELATLSPSVPYMSWFLVFQLPGLGRSTEAAAFLQSLRDSLPARYDTSLARLADTDSLPLHRAAVLHRIEFGLSQDYPPQTFMALRARGLLRQMAAVARSSQP